MIATILKYIPSSLVVELIRIGINRKISKFGKIKTLRIDKKNHYMELFFIPSGKTNEIKIEVNQYRIFRDLDGKTYFEINKISADSLKYNTILKIYTKLKKFEIPKRYVNIAKSILC